MINVFVFGFFFDYFEYTTKNDNVITFSTKRKKIFKFYQMKTCPRLNSAQNGPIIYTVEKYKTSPNVIDIGRAGKAFRKIANRSNVKHKP